VEPVEQNVLEALEASGPVPPAAAEDEAGTAAVAAGTTGSASAAAAAAGTGIEAGCCCQSQQVISRFQQNLFGNFWIFLHIPMNFTS
jgi:hypothetical protein